MGSLTSAKRRRAAVFRTKVALPSTNLNCGHFPAALWTGRLSAMSVWSRKATHKRQTSARPLWTAALVVAFMSEEFRGSNEAKKHTFCGDGSSILSPFHLRRQRLDFDIREWCTYFREVAGSTSRDWDADHCY